MRLRWTIRSRLLSIIIGIALMLIIMIVLSDIAETRNAQERWQSHSLQLARVIAHEIDLQPEGGQEYDVARLQEFAQSDLLQSQETLTIIDQNGTVIVRSANPAQWVGQSVIDVPLVQQAMQTREGVAESPDLDGTQRLHGYASTVTTNWRVIVSVSSAIAYAHVNDAKARSVLLATLIILIAFLGIWSLIRQIEPPLKSLLSDAHLITESDDQIFVGPPAIRDLAELADVFNKLATQRKADSTQSKVATVRNHEIFDNNRDALFVIDLEGHTVDANAAALRLSGRSLSDLRHNNAFDLVPRDAKDSVADRVQRYEQAHGTHDTILITRDGREVPVEVAVTPIMFEGKTALLAAARDVSERRRAEDRLLRLSQRILTLSESGLRMQETLNQDEIYAVIGDELRSQNFNCILAFLSDDQQSARIHYVSDENWETRFRQALDMELIGYTFPVDAPLAKRILLRQQTFMMETRSLLASGLASDLQPVAHAVFEELNITRAILAPLLLKRRVTAILMVTGLDIREVDTPAIASFARQAGVTLENARLYAKATQNAVELGALNRIAAIVSRSLDLPAVLDAVLTQLHSIIEYDSAAVYLDSGTQFVIADSRGYPKQRRALRQPYEPSDLLFQELSQTREAIIVSDVNTSQYFMPIFSDTSLPSFAAWMGVPLFALGELIGFLSIHKQKPDAFTTDSARRAQAFAQIAGSAIENARLYDREKRALSELSALAGITEVGLSVLQLNELLYELIRRVVKSTGAAAGMILLIDGGDHLVTRAAVGLDPAAIGYAQEIGQGFAGRIVATGQSLIIIDAQTDPQIQNPFITEAQIKTVLGVPLKAMDEVVGVAHIDFKTVRQIEDAEIQRFEVMADRAARAIENAQLVGRISRYAEELEQRVIDRTRELEHATAKAQEADKLKSQLLSIVSHELRTPLASIKGYVTTILDHRDRLQSATQTEFLQIIDSETDRLTELVENLLDMSRIEAGVLRIHPEPMALTPVIERALLALQPKLAGHTLEVEMDNSSPDVVIDAGRIQQVLSNLLDNAVKYSPPGSLVRISVKTNETHVTVGIHDKGPGILPEHAQKIFDRFYRIEDARIRHTGGFGLGLAISRALIEEHGGELWLESKPNQGTSFFISLPIADIEEIDPSA